MKKYIYILVAGLIFFTSCDLDKLPSGDILTDTQKEDVITPAPEKLASDINGLAAGLTRYNVLNLDNANHFDFGYPAVCLILESLGQDFVGPDDGYNWFRGPQNYTDKTIDSEYSEFIWKTFYYNVFSANKVLEFAPKGEEERRLQIFRAQSLAFRAFSYLNLVQIYQFTYSKNKTKLGIPIISEDQESLGYNNPRATVEKVYNFIKTDLDEAIELLADYKRGTDKSKVDQNVAYGLRARVNLLMNNWKEAAEDAEKALKGYSPLDLTAASKPGFNSAEAINWIWGIILTPAAEVVQTGILNWPAHLCSFTGNGYTTAVGVYKDANKKFWKDIPESDIRRDWFVNYKEVTTEEGEKDTILTSKLVEDLEFEVMQGGKPKKLTAAEYYGWNEYTNVKFHAYQNLPDNPTNASDWPLMRIEEMILIQAEGLAMSGDLTNAKKVLEDFVVTNRNPEFKSSASSLEEFQEEVWLQRRMELWGEGFSFFDLMRLEKGVVRVGEEGLTSYPETSRYNIEPNSDVLLYMLPQVEVNVNDGIGIDDNNPSAEKPIPVKEQ